MQINISNAKANLSRLLELVSAGEDVIISKAGKPIARLVPFGESYQQRKGGIWKGKLRISEDFDELPPDLLNEFEGKSD